MKLKDVFADQQLNEGLKMKALMAAAALGAVVLLGTGIKISYETEQRNAVIVSQIKKQATSEELQKIKELQDSATTAFSLYASQPNQNSPMANTWRPIYVMRAGVLNDYLQGLQNKYNIPEVQH